MLIVVCRAPNGQARVFVEPGTNGMVFTDEEVERCNLESAFLFRNHDMKLLEVMYGIQE